MFWMGKVWFWDKSTRFSKKDMIWSQQKLFSVFSDKEVYMLLTNVGSTRLMKSGGRSPRKRRQLSTICKVPFKAVFNEVHIHMINKNSTIRTTHLQVLGLNISLSSHTLTLLHSHLHTSLFQTMPSSHITGSLHTHLSSQTFSFIYYYIYFYKVKWIHDFLLGFSFKLNRFIYIFQSGLYIYY